MATGYPPRPPSRTLKYLVTGETPRDVSSALYLITQIPHTKCFRSGNYVIVGLASETDFANHTTTEMTAKLKKSGVQLAESPEMLSSRTIMARRVDEYLLKKTHEDIATEIEEKNGIKVEEVKPIHKAHLLKIRLTSKTDTTHLLERGIKLFSQIIPHYNLEREKYMEVIQCYKCLEFTHRTNACKAPTDTYSKCAKKGHTHKTCNTDTLTCANCGGQHTAVAFKCPKKKEAMQLQNNTNPSKTSNTPTYASTAASTSTTTSPTQNTHTHQPHPDLEKAQLQIQTCLHTASHFAMGDAETFARMYKELLQANNLPTITIPDNLIREVKSAYKETYGRTKQHNTPANTHTNTTGNESESEGRTPAVRPPPPHSKPHPSHSPSPTRSHTARQTSTHRHHTPPAECRLSPVPKPTSPLPNTPPHHSRNPSQAESDSSEGEEAADGRHRQSRSTHSHNTRNNRDPRLRK